MHEYFLGQKDYKLKIKKPSVNNQVSSASEAQHLKVDVIMSCHTSEGAAITEHGDMPLGRSKQFTSC